MVVKGLERNISSLYEARRLLLGLDSCETAKVTEMTPDPVLAGSGLTGYWLNMLLQQLRLSEQGERAHAQIWRVHPRVSWRVFQMLKFHFRPKKTLGHPGKAQLIINTDTCLHVCTKQRKDLPFTTMSSHVD